MQQHFKMVWGPFVWRNREGTEGGRRIQVVLHVDEDDPVEIMMEQHGGEFWSGSLSQLTARELYCWKAAFVPMLSSLQSQEGKADASGR